MTTHYRVACDVCGNVVVVHVNELDVEYDLLDNLYVEPNRVFCPICEMITDVQFLERLRDQP